MLEERGASGGDPAVAVIPGGWRAGWAESVRQPVSLGGAGTGGTAASGVDFKKHERNKCYKNVNAIGSSVLQQESLAPTAELQAKGSFIRQHVNTGRMGPRYCPFSWWAITPTTLVPKTRLTSVSVRPFTL